MGHEDVSEEVLHVQFGMVSLKDQVLSTRKGHVVFLEDVLNKTIEKTYSIMKDRDNQIENLDEAAKIVGIGAVKFQELYNSRIKDYVFDWDELLNFEGETGPYIQYAYARIQSILRKADFKPSAEATYSLDDAESWEIIKLLQDFARVVKRAADNYDPSLIAKYAISLAQAFNKFYAHTRILDESPERDSRLALSYATAVVLKESLRLLGVDAPEKM